MSRSVAVTAVLACFAVASLTACGSDDSGGSSQVDNAAATNAETTVTARTPTPAPAASTTSPSSPKNKATVVTLCHKAFDPFLAQLRKIEKMVDGTPRFATYSAATKKLEADSTAFNASAIPNDSCLRFVSVPTTMSAITHVRAAKEWAECRKRDSCTKAMPTIKKEWREASKFYVRGSMGFQKVAAD